MQLREVLDACEAERSNGKAIVFTHGAFDVLHSGHINFLERARAGGDVLVVGLHLDTHIRVYKGPGRPLLPLRDRMRVVGALRVVDFVISCPGSDAVDVLEVLRPEVYVKDDQVNVQATVEATAVMGYGGQICILPYTAGVSTSMVIRRLLNSIT
jgi:D-beta-D-heptose 7-phosphate kinase / D-beta-D-heptose 1-phosphate adenosyltransferase